MKYEWIYMYGFITMEKWNICINSFLPRFKISGYIYVAGAQKHSEQVNIHKDKSMGLTEVNRYHRFDKYTYTGARNYSESKYTKQSLNNCRNDKSSKSKIQKRSWVELRCITEKCKCKLFFIVCDAKASILKKRQNPTVAWKFLHIVVI